MRAYDARVSLRIALARTAWLVLIPAACAGPWRGSLSPVAPVTFSGLSARDAVGSHCSRRSPESDGSWQPSARCTAELDRTLVGVLASLPSGDRPADIAYERQYAPFTNRGRRYVYINFFQPDEGPSWEAASTGQDRPFDVCDGGNAFFALTYDAARGAFVSYETNGPEGSSLELDVRVTAECSGTGDTSWIDACITRERELADVTATAADDDPCDWYCPTLAEVLRETDSSRLERRLQRLSRCFENQCARAEVNAHLGAVHTGMGKLEEARDDFAKALACMRAFDAQHPAFQNETVRRELCAVMQELERPHFGYCTARAP